MNPLIRSTSDAARITRRALACRRAPPGKRGQSTVEFALIVLPLFIIIFAIIDYAQIYFYENALQNAMREAARFATAGSVIQQTNSGVAQYDTNNGIAVPKAIPDSEGREASRYGCIRMFFQSNCVIKMATNSVQVTSASALPGAPPVIVTNGSGYITLMDGATNVPAVDGPGNAGDYIEVTATYQLHTITPIFGFLNGFQRGPTKGYDTYPVRVSAIVKNEPALLNFEHTNMYSDEAP
jgi:Flp pilus assembly protein TadG